MAIVPSTQYAAQTDTGDPGYPQGKARNAGSFGDGTGTPLEKTWINDLWGFLQSLLAAAGITPSGAPDEVGASDYLDAVQFVADAAASKAAERVMLASWQDGGEIVASEFLQIAWISAWNRFVVTSSNADTYLSPDGEIWTSVTGQASRAIAGNPSGTGVSVSGSGSVRTSTDGSTWTSRTSNTTNELNSVVWTGSQFVAVGSHNGGGDSAEIITSPNGTTAWTVRTVPAALLNEDLYGVAANGSIIVAVGTNGKIVTSPDGSTWTSRTSGTSDDLFKIAWSPALSLFVACGEGGRIVTSPDGTTWTVRTSGTTENLSAVAATDNYLIVAGLDGILLFSADGTTWQRISHSSDSNNFQASGLAWSGNCCVASGSAPSHGRISRSLARLP